jgi:cell pole-organizing protein PopZ
MSAPQLYDDRGDEALRRAQRAHEPSMEEILASIRAIIADDKATAAAKAAVVRPAPAAGSQVIYSSFGQRAADAAGQPVAAPTVVWSRPEDSEPQVAEPEPQDGELPIAEPEPHVAELQVAEPEPQSAEPSPAPTAEAYEPAEEPHEEPLLSEEVDRHVGASFQALAVSLAMPDPRRVEEMTRELLRPMMKAWLDENLPSLVERLVKAEIQRVARGGR